MSITLLNYKAKSQTERTLLERLVSHYMAHGDDGWISVNGAKNKAMTNALQRLNDAGLIEHRTHDYPLSPFDYAMVRLSNPSPALRAKREEMLNDASQQEEAQRQKAEADYNLTYEAIRDKLDNAIEDGFYRLTPTIKGGPSEEQIDIIQTFVETCSDLLNSAHTLERHAYEAMPN